MGKNVDKFLNITHNVLTKKSVKSIISSVICILIGLFMGFLLLLITEPSECIVGITALSFGPLIGLNNFNKYFIGAIARCAPIIMAGLSVLFAYKTGMFNIGAPGQMIVGGFASVAICLTCPFKNAFTPFLGMLGGIVAGALWGFLVGALKALFNVHEVIAAIMLNYIGTYLVSWLAKKPQFFNSAIAQTQYIDPNAVIPTLGLDKLFPKSYLDISIFIAIIIAILIWFILNKTTLGFQLKATGFNKDAAQNASMKYKQNIMISMAISGALAGLGGAILYSSSYSTGIKPEISLLNQGFDGISVALLACLNPIGAIFSGFFIQYIRNAGQIMRIPTSYATEISDIVIGIIIYCSALTTLIIGWFDKMNIKYELSISNKDRNINKTPKKPPKETVARISKLEKPLGENDKEGNE